MCLQSLPHTTSFADREYVLAQTISTRKNRSLLGLGDKWWNCRTTGYCKVAVKLKIMHRALCQMVQRVRLRTHTIPVLTVRTNLLQMKHSTMFGFLGWQKFCNTRYCWNNADKYSTHLGTIYAVSSGHGKCGVSVVRVSGPQTKEAMLSILQKKILPKPRQAILRRFYHPKRQEPLDRGLLLWFPGSAYI